MKKQITIIDVAKEANVSKSAACAVFAKTASNVRLSTETKERILAVAHKLGYSPNIAAKSLNYRKSFLIGFFFIEGNWHVSTQLIRSIQNICYAHKYSLIVYPSRNIDEERCNLNLGVERQLDGILTIPLISNEGDNANEYKRIARDVMPVVQIIFKLCNGIPFVGRDYRQIGKDAVEYLVERGHRRIGLITFSNYKNPVHGVNAFLHYQGYKDAMSAVGLKEEVYPFAQGATNIERLDSIHKNTKKIHSSPYAPTALIATANSLAYGAIKYFMECGIRVPEDISIIGCADDLNLPNCMAPQLTFFPVPFETLGSMAMRKCLNLPAQTLPDEIYLKQKIEGGATVCCSNDMSKSEEIIRSLI